MTKKQSDDTRSRRGVLSGLVATPFVIGGAVNAYETTNRDGDVQSINARAVDRTGEITTSTLGFEDESEYGDETFTYIDASAAMIDAVGRTVGEQVRLRRTDVDDEYAVYTILSETSEREPIVRGNSRARARLDLKNTTWNDTGDRRLFCPRPQVTAPINNGDVTVEVDPMVVHPELTVEEAQEHDEYVEVSQQHSANAIVLSPHGGDVQQHTGEQAETVLETVDGDIAHWGTRGYRNGGGAFVRWYVPSYRISEASYPKLAEINATEYEYAVAFHGTCHPQIQVGGQAPQSFREEIRDAINGVLEGTEYEAVLGRDQYRADGDQTMANRLATRCGIWIGQDKASRANYGTEIAKAVADVLEPRL